jgi:protein involved in polysaccharide export with SLBB domain
MPTILVALVLLAGSHALLLAQQPAVARPDQVRPDQPKGASRAEQEAEQRVAYSTEKIIEVLRNEPALLLRVKKVWVQGAFEQGRIVDSADLSDDAFFRLLWDDESVRILATHEIDNREYLPLKPTRAEAERQRELNERRALRTTAMPEGTRAVRGQHNPDVNGTDQPPQDHDYELQDNGQSPYVAPFPENSVPANPNRQINRAGLQNNINNDENGFGDEGELQSVPANFGSDPQGPDLFNVSSSSDSTLPANDRSENLAGRNESQANSASLSNLRNQRTNTSGPFAQPDNESGIDRTEETRRRVLYQNDSDPNRTGFRHQTNPYASVPSLYDLYEQVSKRSPGLERFGMDVFRNGTGNLESLPMDLPAGPDYVLGPGDGLNIELWGGVAQRLQRVVDREGKVALPEVGDVSVAGRPLGEAQQVVQSVLRTQFHNVEADVSLARIRTVRIYVVGDTVRPGAYDISSLSTPLNALYAAGGPTSRGSLRHLRQYRGVTLVQEMDVYDLLLHGIHTELARIQSGDTILVPPIGPEVVVEGMVRRPAIYELGGETTLAEILELAGGVLSSGTLRHVDVDRVVAHESRTMLRVDLPESNDQQAVNAALDKFQVQDGDKIKISPILPYADKTVYLDGHVFRPGKYPYREGMKVTDILHSYSDLLPEPAANHAEIIRLQAPDNAPIVLAFDLANAIQGKDQDLTLRPFDTIRVFGRYDFEDQPVITVTGEVRFAGDHVTNGTTRLRDAVYMAGGTSPDAELNDAQVFRRTEDGTLKVMSVDLSKALIGDEVNNIVLLPKDRLFIHRSPLKVDPPTVLIQGEVVRPGKYPLGQGMTASELIKLAGGLKRSADLETADIARYLASDGSSAGEHRSISIASAIAGNPDADQRLIDGDVLTIRQVAGWSDMESVVTVRGEVVHPGTYGIQEGERLSSVLARAGGFRRDAYPYGAVLERVQVRQLEEKNRVDLIRHVQYEGASLKLIPETDDDQKMAKQASLMQWQTTLDKLQNTPPSGRLVIHITKEPRWANTPADLELRKGDILTIPKTSNFVMVDGSVYNPTAVTFRPGKTAAWYLRQAGGPNNIAEKKAIFLIRADGSVAGGTGGAWDGGALSAEVRPGDMLVVPEKAFSGTTRWKSTLQMAQLVSAAGIAIQVARGF